MPTLRASQVGSCGATATSSPNAPAGIFRFLLRYAGRHPLVFLMANLTLNVYRMVGTSELAREAFRLASAKLPIATTFVVRQVGA